MVVAGHVDTILQTAQRKLMRSGKAQHTGTLIPLAYKPYAPGCCVDLHLIQSLYLLERFE